MILYLFVACIFIFAALELYGEYKDNYTLIIAFKPLVLPFIVLFYIFGAHPNIDWLIVVALLCGWAGDILLMLKDGKWFLYGMVAFLFNQIFFIISFFISISDISDFNIWGLFLLGPVILAMLFAVPKFINKTGDLKIPVLVYIVAILLMHIAAVLRLAEFTGLEFIFIYVGSIFFIVSDIFLALNKWDKAAKQKRIINMITYFLAQFYIALGAVFTSLM
ncbi:MAG: lysoplasmalogenase [Candidatus Hodarchaeota archaeon]